LGALWDGLVDGLKSILELFHGLLEPVAGAWAWGWAIVLLTITVRLVLLPLAIKQTHSMRAMQGLQPEIKKIQKKYKADRDLMRKDPEKYRERRAKQQEEMMALYKEHNVNPAAGCLPLILQMPIFFALFTLLRGDRVPELADASFLWIQGLTHAPTFSEPLTMVLVLAMGLTTFFSQKQMMANNPQMAAQPQQKVLLYAMPVMLTFFALQIFVGVLLYWVTTNVWTIGQQWVMFRNLEPPGTTAQTAKNA
jgi:YidC/Oxa1 family membrane protein insertase